MSLSPSPDCIRFIINGNKYVVYESDVQANTTLNDYIREHAELRGTKYMCQEGGCGACIVVASVPNVVTGEKDTYSVNSCLVPILKCHNWVILTIEGLGNRKDGYHALQTKLASSNGSQCGYCSPSWIMAMYGLLESNNQKITMAEIENSLASNTCRCTGYRPILDALKSFASDYVKSEPLIEDIENLNLKKCCKDDKYTICTSPCKNESDWCLVDADLLHSKPLMFKLNGNIWFKVFALNDVFKILEDHGVDSYMLLNGNTAKGVYEINTYPRIVIDISSVDDGLKEHYVDVNLVLGAGLSLSQMMDVLTCTAECEEYFKYLNKFIDHMHLVAHVPVRNSGSIGGNLMLKNKYNEFPSDLFLLFTTVGATVTIINKSLETQELTMIEFMHADMTEKVLLNVKLPPLCNLYLLKTYKIMPRAQNAHAQVNAGFLYKYNQSKSKISEANIIFGGINTKFVHASETEAYIVGKDLFTNNVLQGALNTLSNEIFPNYSPPEPSPQFRKKLALGLFYKGVVALCPSERVGEKIKSAGAEFVRHVSSGKQDFETFKEDYPLRKPIPKIEALRQCAGEAIYSDDIPSLPHEVFAAFVLSTVSSGEIEEIDPKEAMLLSGVSACYTAKDIPGTNSFIKNTLLLMSANEEILCSGKVLFYGQPLAIIVANDQNTATMAAKLVKVKYTKTGAKPILTVREALASSDISDRMVKSTTYSIKATDKGTDTTKVIKGTFDTGEQYHYTMELQACIAIPNEDEFDIYSSCQWKDQEQIVIAEMLSINTNRINIIVGHVGGAFGSKVTRCQQVACGAALVAHLQNVPCRFIMPLESIMNALGKRSPCSFDYEAGIDADGLIQYLEMTSYQDNGSSHNEDMTLFTNSGLLGGYDSTRWNVTFYSILTDKPSCTYVRSPGTLEGTAVTNHIMEHIAFALNKDSTEVKIKNMRKVGYADTSVTNPLPELVTEIKTSSDYSVRYQAVQEFNRKNRWRKRSIQIMPVAFSMIYAGTFTVVITVYHTDGTVAITHGGIEMGQGINTKVAQVVAYKLGVSLDEIVVKRSTTEACPNDMVTGASMASDLCCSAANKACDILIEKLKPVKTTLTNPTWKELVAAAYTANVCLLTSYMWTSADNSIYDIFSVSCIEIEVDILTGNYEVIRLDLLQDTGKSLSPEIDIGQVEGAFIYGLGFWTCENIIYDKTTGAILTNRTWNYKPIQCRDIPIDFRVTLRKKSINKTGVLGSKATGEPPLCLSTVVSQAFREIIVAAKTEANKKPKDWFYIEVPHTNENVVCAIDSEYEEFVLQ